MIKTDSVARTPKMGLCCRTSFEVNEDDLLAKNLQQDFAKVMHFHIDSASLINCCVQVFLIEFSPDSSDGVAKKDTHR